MEHDGIAAFLEYLQPPMHLLICGAGDDAQPLARIAADLAWSVDLLDTRARLATTDRFPTASHVIAGIPARAAEWVHPHSAIVLMSHRFADDLEFLAALLATEPPSCSPAYIGLLGPRRRADRMLTEIAERGIRPTPKQSAAIRTPVGLDLGSNSPETIAALDYCGNPGLRRPARRTSVVAARRPDPWGRRSRTGGSRSKAFG